MTVSGDSGFVHAGPYSRRTGLTNTSPFRSKEGTRITREIPQVDHYQGFGDKCLFSMPILQRSTALRPPRRASASFLGKHLVRALSSSGHSSLPCSTFPKTEPIGFMADVWEHYFSLVRLTLQLDEGAKLWCAVDTSVGNRL